MWVKNKLKCILLNKRFLILMCDLLLRTACFWCKWVCSGEQDLHWDQPDCAGLCHHFWLCQGQHSKLEPHIWRLCQWYKYHRTRVSLPWQNPAQRFSYKLLLKWSKWGSLKVVRWVMWFSSARFDKSLLLSQTGRKHIWKWRFRSVRLQWHLIWRSHLFLRLCWLWLHCYNKYVS